MPLRLKTEIRPLTLARRWVNSDRVDVNALRGRPVLVHFWALSCQASRAQLPRLGEWAARHRGQLHVLSVHTPLEVDDLDADHVTHAVHELGIDLPVALDEDGGIADAYDIRSTPSYFLFDAQGRLRGFHAGPEAADPIEHALSRLIEEEAAREREAAAPH